MVGSRAPAVIIGRHWASATAWLNAALNRLVMQSERLAHGKNEGLPATPAISAPARPGLLVPFRCAIDINFAVSSSVSVVTSIASTAMRNCTRWRKSPGSAIRS